MKMADKLIMEIKIDIDNKTVTGLKGQFAEVVMIPFTGSVKSEIFNGAVLDGVDTQRVNLSGVRHMSARYMLDGEDYTGAKCKIFVENNGWFEGFSAPFKTVPTFLTDSKALAPYLHQNKFRGEGHGGPDGLTIKMFEVIPD